MRVTVFSVFISIAASAMAYSSDLSNVDVILNGHNILKRQEAAAQTLTDADILNFALTLEHLENTFYSQGLKNYSSSDFASASSLGKITYANIQEIGSDEANHVELLTGALSAAGATPVQSCTYKFPSTDAHSFLGLAQVLEGVGVSAYIGAAQYIANPAYLEVAASILTVEARHNAFIRLANGYSPFPSPYDTGLSPRAIVSLAGSFFASCPDGSAPTIQPFPAATLTSANATIGSTLAVSVNSSVIANQANIYCAFASGVQTAFSTYNNGLCTLPAQNVTGGQVYGLLTSSMNISDASTLAGPFIINVDTANNTVTGSSKDVSVNAKSSGMRSVVGGAASAVAMLAALLV